MPATVHRPSPSVQCPVAANDGLCSTYDAGLVEAWVGGSDWDQVTKDCSLDPGDVARLLSRTADLLRQVSGALVWLVAGLASGCDRKAGMAAPCSVS